MNDTMIIVRITYGQDEFVHGVRSFISRSGGDYSRDFYKINGKRVSSALWYKQKSLAKSLANAVGNQK